MDVKCALHCHTPFKTIVVVLAIIIKVRLLFARDLSISGDCTIVRVCICLLSYKLLILKQVVVVVGVVGVGNSNTDLWMSVIAGRPHEKRGLPVASAVMLGH